ncbi:MAG: response regulator [Candidatus Omnitrophica bacterium]|nr:response regulator [Candidatus Omnitrophota bacterium]
MEKIGMAVQGAESGYAVLGYLRRAQEPDLVILDLVLPERSGVELLCSLRAKWQNAKIFIFSGHEEYQEREALLEYVQGFFPKARGFDDLMAAIMKLW